MPKRDVIIIKMGGSIVTLKQGTRPAIRRAHVKSIARLLKKEYDPEKHSLILIHGAGSFGHIHAHAHGLKEGTKDHPKKLFRATENQALDEQLNSELATLFTEAGLPVTGIPTRAITLNTQGSLTRLETRVLTAALKSGAIPLLHGDMIFDIVWGLSICSGDVLAAKLAQHFSASKVFFASDVDGIFSKDPHVFRDATLISHARLSDVLNGTFNLGSSHNIDVTGGLSKKFSLFKKHPKLKSIYFFNGLKVENFVFLFNQKNFFGTHIENKKR